MSKLDEYLNRAKDLAEDAGDMAKNIAREAQDKAKELTAEGSKVRELKKSAIEQASAMSLGAREKVEGLMKDSKAVKEISLGITELEAMPEFEGSILYTMEVESMINDLKKMQLLVADNRLDDGSVTEEIRKVMDKVRLAEDDEEGKTEEQQAIDNAKTIAFGACARALEALKVSE